MTITVKSFVDTSKIISEEKSRQGDAKMRTAYEFARLADPYVPQSNAHKYHMSETVNRSPFNQGKIVYDTSYASFVYNRNNATTHWSKLGSMSHWGEYVAEKYKTELARTFERALKGEM